MDLLNEYLGIFDWKLLAQTSFRLLFIVVVAWFFRSLLDKLLGRLKNRLDERAQAAHEARTEYTKRVETLILLVRQGGIVVLWLVVGLVILKEVGVEIAPILASAGIVGLAVGFGGQNLVRDVISGFFIILEDQIRVGDVAIINGTGGLVEEINFRTIILRDLGGVVHIFPNGAVTSLSNLTKEWSAYVFDIGVAYKENTDAVVTILEEVGRELKEDAVFGPMILEEPEIFGVDKLDNSAVVIKGRIKTVPIQQWAVGREFLRRVKQAFDARGIEIPFPHQTVYFGEASKPFAVHLLERKKREENSGEVSSPESGDTRREPSWATT
ncbi:MAG: mechanosensitive ion channel family protein [Deltaproteobacteria bacterium]|uniref:mechanosensitive ion channel family protein n=1 Tax=Hydrosulfovibrio ferrireducens TaxID=2934181 RepID=UPI00120E2A3A|nr:MAG: mechanosensitive ion channel family protein [Deltaproteobacteria bacterium]